MTRRLTLALIGQASLGLAHVTEESRSFDWSEAFNKDSGEPGFHTVLPPATLGAMAEYAPDLLTEAQKARAQTAPHTRPSAEALGDAFEQSDGFDDYRQAFEPMMSFMYPVRLRMEQDPRELAALLQEFAPSVTLCEFESDFAGAPDASGDDVPYAFALSGGGMDLSDQLVAAYLCAGHVPPYWMLSRQAGVMGDVMRSRLSAVLPKAYKQAAEWFRWRAKDMAGEAKRVYPPKPKA